MNIEIIEYEDCHQPVFKELNVAWLDHYNLTETHDLEILSDPRKYILDNKGAIYLVRHQGEIVGSAALINEQNGIYELAKMAVAPRYQKMGISKLLLERCITKARELQGVKIILFSNHKLKVALALYEKYGFRYIPMKDSPFTTADIKMELAL